MVSRLAGIFGHRGDDLDCREVRNLSSDYIDSELDQAAAERVKSHLDSCPPCKSFVNTLRATVSLLRATPKRQPRSNFRQRIREGLRKELPE